MKKEPFCITPQMAAQKAADSCLVGSEDSDEIRLIKKAFTLGFMISREGFNGEFMGDWIAESLLEAHYPKTEREFFEEVKASAAFQSLMNQAVKYLTENPT